MSPYTRALSVRSVPVGTNDTSSLVSFEGSLGPPRGRRHQFAALLMSDKIAAAREAAAAALAARRELSVQKLKASDKKSPGSKAAVKAMPAKAPPPPSSAAASKAPAAVNRGKGPALKQPLAHSLKRTRSRADSSDSGDSDGERDDGSGSDSDSDVDVAPRSGCPPRLWVNFDSAPHTRRLCCMLLTCLHLVQ